MIPRLKQLGLFSWTVLAEARGSRVLLSSAVIFLLAFAVALFVGEISITESRQSQAGLTAAFLRWGILFYLALFTINSVVRDMNDRMLLLYLSLPVSRLVFVLGKFLGFALLALAFSIVATIMVSQYADVYSALFWGLSLLLESWLVIGFSLLCAFGFGNMTLAFSALTGIYLISRMLHALLLMASNPLTAVSNSLAQRFIEDFLTGLDYVLPRLDRFTRSEWLMYGEVGTAEISFVVQQAIVYLFLLLAMICFDFYRKDF